MSNTSLTDLSLLGYIEATSFSAFHQVFLCRIYVLLQMCQFLDKLYSKLFEKKSYQKASIGNMSLKLPELQVEDTLVKVVRAK